MTLAIDIIMTFGLLAFIGILVYGLRKVIQGLSVPSPTEWEEGLDPALLYNSGGPQLDNDSWNASFLAKAQGQETIKLLRIYNRQDVLILRSLLASLGIENYLAYSNMGDLLPGMRIQGHTDMVLVILAEDRDDAVAAVQTYLEEASAVIDYRQYRWLGIFFGIFFLSYPVPQRTLPELLLSSV
jgi:hypothetical protein